MNGSTEAPPSNLKVAAVVAFYMFSALIMVFVNKAVLVAAPELPFTLLFIQLSIAVALLHMIAFSLRSRSERSTTLPTKYSDYMLLSPSSSSSSFSHSTSKWAETFAIPEWDLDVARRMFPVVSIGVIGLIFNTLCLRNVDASFFQIARGLLLPFTILVSAINSRSIPRRPVLYAAMIVTVGFTIGTSPQSFFSSANYSRGFSWAASREKLVGALDTPALISLAYGSLSALMTAIHAVMVKGAMKHVDGSVVKLAYWTNLLSGFFLLPCILLNGEAHRFFTRMFPLVAPLTPELASIASSERSMFFLGSALTGVFGLLLGIAGILSIKVTSPVTHMFSAAARSGLQTVLGVAIFGEVVTSQRATSIVVITLGAIYYIFIQQSAPRRSASAPINLVSPPNSADSSGTFEPTSPRHGISRPMMTHGRSLSGRLLGSIIEDDEKAEELIREKSVELV